MDKRSTQYTQYRKSCKVYCFVIQGLALDSFVETWRCQGLGSTTNLHCVISQKKDGLNSTAVDAWYLWCGVGVPGEIYDNVKRDITVLYRLTKYCTIYVMYVYLSYFTCYSAAFSNIWKQYELRVFE